MWYQKRTEKNYQLKGKLSSTKGKITRVVNQLKKSVPGYIELAVDATEKELDRTALEISNRWKRLEQGIRELENSTILLTEVDPKDVADEPEKLIEKTNTDIDEFCKVYLVFKTE